MLLHALLQSYIGLPKMAQLVPELMHVTAKLLL